MQDQLKEVEAFLGKSLVFATFPDFFGATCCTDWVGNSSITGFGITILDHVWPFESISKVEKSVVGHGNVGKAHRSPRLYCTSSAFAAVLSNGRVVTWGNNLFGGDSGAVQDQLRDVQKIESTLENNLVVQFMTFLSPDVGGHDSPLQKGHLSIPKRLRIARSSWLEKERKSSSHHLTVC